MSEIDDLRQQLAQAQAELKAARKGVEGHAAALTTIALLTEQHMEAQAAKAQCRAALEAWERYIMHPDRRSSPARAWREAVSVHRQALASDGGEWLEAMRLAKEALEDAQGRPGMTERTPIGRRVLAALAAIRALLPEYAR